MFARTVLRETDESLEKMGPLTAFYSSTQGKFRHNTYTASAKSTSHYFLKEVPSAAIGLREVIAQEYFRLMIAEQPETGLAKNISGEQVYVTSKQIPEFNSLYALHCIFSKPLIKRFDTNEYHGLGEVIVTSLVTNEVDLKLGNVGINAQKKILKIDGDESFARLIPEFADRKFPITQRDIKNAPFIEDYEFVNLLGPDIKSVVSTELSENLAFRHEVNFSMLKNIILPDEMISGFVKKYGLEEKEADLLSNELNSNRAKLREEALKNNHFQQYLLSPKAQEDLSSFIETLKVFKTSISKEQVFSSDCEKEIYKTWDELRKGSVADKPIRSKL